MTQKNNQQMTTLEKINAKIRRLYGPQFQINGYNYQSDNVRIHCCIVMSYMHNNVSKTLLSKIGELVKDETKADAVYSFGEMIA